jgi:chromosome segregation ATPase
LNIPEGSHTVVFAGLNSEVDSRRATVGFDGGEDGAVEVLSVNHRTQQINNTQNTGEIDRLLAERTDIENRIRELQIDLDVNSYEQNMLRVNLQPENSDAESLRRLLELHRERIRSIEFENGSLTDSLQVLRTRINEINKIKIVTVVDDVTALQGIQTEIRSGADV